jgi:colanic acid/amylovoran biosynthesis glycosyltransferase
VVRVLHYVEHWLELSAGFVHAQVIRSSHPKVVVSHNATENLASFPVRPLFHFDRLADAVPPRRWPAVRTTALRGIATAYRTDVVHVHFGYVVRDVLPIVSRRRHLVLSLHGDDALALPHRQPGHYGPVIDVVSAVVVPSTFLADAAVELGFDRDRLHVIPSGIDTEFFAPTPVPTEPVVTFVGRLVEKKGIDTLLAAWPTIRATVGQARLRILGAGPLASLLPSDDLSIEHVHPDPRRRAEQVRDVIRSAKVVATPSRTTEAGDAESLLLVNLEAQASGRPVVTTDHGGITDFVARDESAFVVPERDADALAEALIAILADDGLARRLGSAGPAVARRFDVADCAARVDELYSSLRSR